MNADRKQSMVWKALSLAIAASLMATTALAQEEEEDPFALDETAETPTTDEERRRELTEVRSWVEFGLGTVSDDSFRFGRYSGLERQGGFGVLDFDLRRRGAWDSDSAEYWRISGSDLGLRSRELGIEYGVQGRYRLSFDFDEIPTYRIDDGQTPFLGAGGAELNLPPGWVAGTTTAGMSNLRGSLNELRIEHLRRRFELGFESTLNERWEFATHYRRQSKDGTKTVGAVIGNSGGNPRAVILPEPTDYRDDQMDVVLRYRDGPRQWQVGYHLSLFKNDHDALLWRNPYAAIAGWQASAGFPTGYGSGLLPPDNQFHQFSVGAGYDFSRATRFSADLALGRMTQDETFLPYTVNPVLAASITQPLPRASLDGRIDSTVLNLRLTSRPSPQFRWNASFRLDDRDNRTSRDEYVYIGGDSQIQVTGPTSDRRRFNAPYSFREEKLRFDAGYRLSRRLDLTAAAERRRYERSYSEREAADEDTFSLGLRSNFSELISGELRLSRAERSGSTYYGAEPFLSGYAPGQIAVTPGPWRNVPLLRRFFLADRDRDQASLRLTLTPAAAWTIGLNASYLDDDYSASEVGLTRSRSNDVTLDMAFAPTEHWSGYGFHSYQKLDSEQAGQSVGTATRLIDAANPARNWWADHRDRIETSGLGFNYALPGKKLQFGVDYLHSRSEGDILVLAGSALSTAPLPQLTTRLNSYGLSTSYRMRNDLRLKLRYWLEDYRSSDWALDGVRVNQLANVLLLGEDSPDYWVSVVSLSFVYRF